MRRVLTLMAILAVSFVVSSAQDKRADGLSEEGRLMLQNAIALVDEGLFDAAVDEYKELLKEYPDNYLVLYEYAYALYAYRKYEEVLKMSETLLKHKDVQPLAYQLCGNAYDILGKPDKARSVYRQGLEKFPGNGALYLELGNVDFNARNYGDALDFYLEGIKTDPNFASNYYRASLICLSAESLYVWGLIYAETEILLAPGNEARHADMAKAMRECLIENVKVTVDGDSCRGNVTLAPSRVINMSSDASEVYLAFPGVYEGCAALALAPFVGRWELFVGTVDQLIELRYNIVESYYKVCKNLFGKSMYLIEFQKKIIDAGHWDAYNYFIFGDAAPEEFERWHEQHSDAYDAFVDWYNADPFCLGDGRSVGERSIYDNCKPMDMMESLMIQGGLLVDPYPLK